MAREGPPEMDPEVGIRERWAGRMGTSWARDRTRPGLECGPVIGGAPLSPGCRGRKSQIHYGG